MTILIAVLAVAVLAAVAVVVMQRRTALHPPRRPAHSPLPPRGRRSARRDPMASAVAEHARATHPADVVVAEQRLQAQARHVAAGMQAGARNGATHPAPAPTDAPRAEPRSS